MLVSLSNGVYETYGATQPPANLQVPQSSYIGPGLTKGFYDTMAHLHLAHLISFSSSPAPYARLLGSAIATFDGQNTLVVRRQRHVCLLITKHAYRRIKHGFMVLFLIECRGEAQLSSATVRENERGVLCCWADLILPFAVRRGETTGMCITRRHLLPFWWNSSVVGEVVLGSDLG